MLDFLAKCGDGRLDDDDAGEGKSSNADGFVEDQFLKNAFAILRNRLRRFGQGTGEVGNQSRGQRYRLQQ